MHAKQNFYTLMDSELNVKIPQYLKKSFEIVREISKNLDIYLLIV